MLGWMTATTTVAVGVSLFGHILHTPSTWTVPAQYTHPVVTYCLIMAHIPSICFILSTKEKSLLQFGPNLVSLKYSKSERKRTLKARIGHYEKRTSRFLKELSIL